MASPPAMESPSSLFSLVPQHLLRLLSSPLRERLLLGKAVVLERWERAWIQHVEELAPEIEGLMSDETVKKRRWRWWWRWEQRRGKEAWNTRGRNSKEEGGWWRRLEERLWGLTPRTRRRRRRGELSKKAYSPERERKVDKLLTEWWREMLERE